MKHLANEKSTTKAHTYTYMLREIIVTSSDEYKHTSNGEESLTSKTGVSLWKLPKLSSVSAVTSLLLSSRSDFVPTIIKTGLGS